MAEMIQRAGRAVRNQDMRGLFLEMYEPWVLEHSLDGDEPDASDPDKPYAGTLKKNSSKQDRTGCAALRFAQSAKCLREFLANYLNDCSPTALSHTTMWCCDRHDDPTFDLSDFFLGDLYTGNTDTEKPPATKRKRKTLRPKEEREILLAKLTSWRSQAHASDTYRSRPVTWLCDDDGLELLSKTDPDNLRSVEALINLLGETEEWGQECGIQIFNVISRFDGGPGCCTDSPSLQIGPPLKRARVPVSSVFVA
ncbi:hypothetical protein HYDPIDRAFT_34911 [Hydnomerulius pinastri MD-312]|uniref:Uncharacterized protein n=1 Tax=Hydnomerulius pinastri MD-312 TaxID=994086 RepID=A0A0C9W588_9AGAM|nr:hypothetical protein HYDPIDRAFT_34911 [Hydnomerulius pinastri MD-312]